MRFDVTRTSHRGSTAKSPCEFAVKRRREDDRRKFYWTIDLDSLAALTGFAEIHGEIILGPDWIEIYDSYRE